MPFGLTNTPVTFQAFINNVLKKYLNIFIIIYPNILINGRETPAIYRVSVTDAARH